jgi:hypothetical protein
LILIQILIFSFLFILFLHQVFAFLLVNFFLFKVLLSHELLRISDHVELSHSFPVFPLLFFILIQEHLFKLYQLFTILNLSSFLTLQSLSFCSSNLGIFTLLALYFSIEPIFHYEFEYFILYYISLIVLLALFFLFYFCLLNLLKTCSHRLYHILLQMI